MDSHYHKTYPKPNTSHISLGPNETCQKIYATPYSVLPYSTTTPMNRLSVANTPKVRSLYTSSGENQGLLKVLWTSAMSVPNIQSLSPTAEKVWLLCCKSECERSQRGNGIKGNPWTGTQNIQKTLRRSNTSGFEGETHCGFNMKAFVSTCLYHVTRPQFFAVSWSNEVFASHVMKYTHNVTLLHICSNRSRLFESSIVCFVGLKRT